MGYNNSATTVTLTAKLTPIGRQLMVSNNNLLITKFSLGDSDANYYASLPLTTGQIPVSSGNIGAGGGVTNSVATNISLRSALILDSTGISKKSVETQSNDITIQTITNTKTIISGNNITQKIIDRNNNTTDSLVNLFYSFGLPLKLSDDITYTGKTFSKGGFSDTAISGFATNKIIVIGLANNFYGELLDGKEVKITLPTSAGTYTIYSTFQSTNTPITTQDANYIDSSINLKHLGNNIALLFSDLIKKPNGGDVNLSWATGFGTTKPFNVNKKQLFNLIDNLPGGLTADTSIGIAYLDKGLIVITNPTIVNDFGSGSTGTSITYNSVSFEVSQNIVCIANKGEFLTSGNSTFSSGDTPRISEVALYDDSNNLIAIAKADRHIVKSPNQFLALGIKINL